MTDSPIISARLERDRRELTRRLAAERRAHVSAVIRGDRRKAERRAAVAAAITSARQADWTARFDAARRAAGMGSAR